jgi:hypothetical protein
MATTLARRLRRHLFILLTALLAAATVAQACSGSPPARQANMGHWEKSLILYAEAATDTTDPHLSTDSASGAATSYRAGDATEGARNGLDALQDKRGAPHTFSLKQPLARDYWLNLSKPVHGALYWSSTPDEASGRDGVHLRIEAYADTTLIGGDENIHILTAARTAWAPLYFCFRPEVATLKQGQTLSLKIYMISGSSDFKVGTGPDKQTFIEFRHFNSDPLAGGLYVDGRTLITGTEDEPTNHFLERAQDWLRNNPQDPQATQIIQLPPAPEAANAQPWTLLALLPLLGLVTISAPRDGRAILAALTLVALVLSGCIGGGTQSDDSDGGTGTVIDTGIGDDDKLAELGHGAIQGTIKDGEKANLPFKKAHVSLLRTTLFTKSDDKGHFLFPNVTAGPYIIRIDADGFGSIQKNITVQNGKRTYVNVTLFLEGSQPGNSRSHIHDDWGEATVLPFQDVTGKPASTSYLGDGVQGRWICAGSTTNGPVCIDTLLPIDVTKPILPGATLVTATLNWDTNAPLAPKELGLRITTATNSSSYQSFMPRAPNVPFHIPFFPNEADPGHQKFTSWRFYLQTPYADVYQPHERQVYSGLSVRFTATIHKGVVPYEKPHPDMWGSRTEFVLASNVQKGSGTAGYGYPQTSTVSHWTPAKDTFVPPGTKEVIGSLSWENPYSNAEITKWTLGYRPANIPASAWNPDDTTTWKTVDVIDRTPTKINFRIDLSTPEAQKQTDQFYQKSSYWEFFVDDGQEATAAGNYRVSVTHQYQTAFFLTATAVKDPNYKDV